MVPLSALLPLLACSTEEARPLDLRVEGGTIYLDAATRTEALGIRDGHVVATGAEAQGMEARTVLDLDGGVLVPGFTDAHVHLLAGSFVMDRLLLLGRSSMEAIVNAAADYALSEPEEPWIVGYGWLKEQVEDPDGRLLDAVLPDRPALLVDNSGHAALVNSVAMARAGITAATPDPPDGTIVRDPETGAPTGYLIEGALDLVSAVALADYDDAALSGGLVQAMDGFVTAGLTGVAEILASPGFDLARPWIYADLEAAGALPLRVHYYVPVFAPDEVQAAAAWRDLYDGDRLRFSGAKLWVDGSMGTSDAWMSEPLEGTTDDFGSWYFDTAALTEVAVQAEALGVPLKLHANGDAAVTAALDAFEAAAARGGGLSLQHTLDHACLVADADLARIAELGLVVSVQPGHQIGAALGDVAVDWGEERFAQAYDYRELADAGVPLALGTDWPVWPTPNPVVQIWAAASRAEGGLSATEGLEAATAGSAQAVGRAQDLGSLQPGMLADMVVLDGDPLEVPVTDISAISVLSVWLAGEQVY